MPKPKILVMTTMLGGGHMATAKAITQAIEKVYPDRFEVKVLDVLKESKMIVTLDKIFVPFYKSSVRNLNGYPYKAFYQATNLTHDIMRRLLGTVFHTDTESIMRREDPDVVISTFWFIGYAVSAVVKQPWPKKVKVVSIITDSGDVHRMWLLSNEDAVLVSTPETIDYAQALGAPREIMHYLGFPIDSRFAKLPTKLQARQKLKLKSRRFTILVNGGGWGLNNRMLALAKKLSRLELDVQYLFVSGHDSGLKQRLEKIKFTDQVRIFGFVDNMPELIAASDLIVGKAGWISLCEAMAAKRPVMIVDLVPGQEEPNAEYIRRHQLGWVIRNTEQAVAKIVELAANPTLLVPTKRRLAKLNFDPRAGERIARFVVENFLTSTNRRQFGVSRKQLHNDHKR